MRLKLLVTWPCMWKIIQDYHSGPRVTVSSIQSLSCVRLFATPWIAARQASLSITNFWTALKLMSIKSVMPSNHLILCRPLLLLPPIPRSIRVFSNESTLDMKWPKYWSFSFSISPGIREGWYQALTPVPPGQPLSCEAEQINHTHKKVWQCFPTSVLCLPLSQYLPGPHTPCI